MFLIQGAEAFFQEHVEHHADARQGRLEFVTDGRDEIGLGIVEEPEAGHIVQDPAAPIAKLPLSRMRWMRGRKDFPGRQSEGQDFVEAVGQEVPGVFDDRGGRGGQFGRQSALDGELCAQFPGRAVF